MVVNVHSGGVVEGHPARPGHGADLRHRGVVVGGAAAVGACCGAACSTAIPNLRFAITEDGAWWLPDIVERMDEKWVGGHNTRKFGSLFRDAVAAQAERVPRHERVPRRVDADAPRDQHSCARRRAHAAVGQRLPAPRGHVAPHPRVDPRRVPRRATRRDRRDARPHRRRGVRLRRRQARRHSSSASARPSKRSTDDEPTRATIGKPDCREGASRTGSCDRRRGIWRRAARCPATPRSSTRRPPGARAHGDRPLPVPGPQRLVRRRHVRRRSIPARCARCTTSAATSCSTAATDGAPRVVDAYCAHLGAHLAVGGRVEGDCIRCPFHGWALRRRDRPVHRDPLRRRRAHPGQGRVRAYPTIERGGAIWAWHHLDEGEPFYELPVVPRSTTPEWTPPMLREFHDLDVVPGDGREQPRLRPLPVRARHRVDPRGRRAHRRHVQAVKNPGLERETFGLGLGVVRVPGMLTFVSSVTPVDDDNVHVRWFFTRAGRQRRRRAERSSPSSSPPASPRTSRSGRTRSTGRSPC